MSNEKFVRAISFSDFKKYGCVECNCEYCYSASGVSGGGASMVKCGECETEFVILADGKEESTNVGFGYKGKLFSHAVVKGEFAYPIREDHPHKIAKHAFVRPDARPAEGEYFSPRGVGYDLAGFVKSKAAGERLVEMFNSMIPVGAVEDRYCFVTGKKPAWLDYREDEPLWIQVKIGYAPDKKNNIEALCILSECTQTLTKDMITIAQNDKLATQIVEQYNKKKSEKLGDKQEVKPVQKKQAETQKTK